VRRYAWNEEKNEKLKRERGVSFEEAVFCIENGRLLDIIEHPDQSRYPGQKLYVVDIAGYAHYVPVVETGQAAFLKTIIPSRKATKAYIKKKEGAHEEKN